MVGIKRDIQFFSNNMVGLPQKIVRPIKTLIRRISHVKNIVCSKIRILFPRSTARKSLYSYNKYRYLASCNKHSLTPNSYSTVLKCLSISYCIYSIVIFYRCDKIFARATCSPLKSNTYYLYI